MKPKLDEITEGLADYAFECAERDAREILITWALEVLKPDDDEDCGFGIYAREQLSRAHRHAREVGVFDEQPGEAAWMTMHRREREG